MYVLSLLLSDTAFDSRSYASLPQKGADGAERTAEETETFKLALEAMGLCYASMSGTAVVQLTDIPPRPAEYDGRITLFGSSATEAALREDLRRFGEVLEVSVGRGQAHARFATHEQAESCVADCRRRKGKAADIDFVYNATAYDKAGVGEPEHCRERYSGWCTFEQGVSTMVVAHLAEAAAGQPLGHVADLEQGY